MKFTALVICLGLFAGGLVATVGKVGDAMARLATLERTVEACCSTTTKDPRADDDLEIMVTLRKQVDDLGRELERLAKKLEER